MTIIAGNPSVDVNLNTTGSSGVFRVNDGTADNLVVDSVGNTIVSGDLAVNKVMDKTGGTLTLQSGVVRLITGAPGWDFSYSGGIQKLDLGNRFRVTALETDVASGANGDDPARLMTISSPASAPVERLSVHYDPSVTTTRVEASGVLDLAAGPGADVVLTTASKVQILGAANPVVHVPSGRLVVDAVGGLRVESPSAPRVQLFQTGAGGPGLVARLDFADSVIESLGTQNLRLESAASATFEAANGAMSIRCGGDMDLTAGGTTFFVRRTLADEVIRVDLANKTTDFYDSGNNVAVSIQTSISQGPTVVVGDGSQDAGNIEVLGTPSSVPPAAKRAGVIALGSEVNNTRYLSVWENTTSGKLELWFTDVRPTTRPTTAIGEMIVDF